MSNMIGYMLTWTTYGTWLQGDQRGYVKKGLLLRGNQGLEQSNQDRLKGNPVKLKQREKHIVRQSLADEAEKLAQKIYALAVCSNHVHIVVKYISEPIDGVVCAYKNASIKALKDNGIDGKIWTKGYDKRYCFDKGSLANRINYVLRHDKE